MAKSKHTPEQKTKIVIESLNKKISVEELSRKHNISPQTLQQWREKFLETAKNAFLENEEIDSLKRERDTLKRKIYEQVIVIDAFKKVLEEDSKSGH